MAPGRFIYTADPVTNAGAYDNRYIQFVTWDNAGPVAEGILTYSQSSDSTSPHFSDQTRKYTVGEWIKLPYTDKQLRPMPITANALCMNYLEVSCYLNNSCIRRLCMRQMPISSWI